MIDLGGIIMELFQDIQVEHRTHKGKAKNRWGKMSPKKVKIVIFPSYVSS